MKKMLILCTFALCLLVCAGLSEESLFTEDDVRAYAENQPTYLKDVAWGQETCYAYLRDGSVLSYTQEGIKKICTVPPVPQNYHLKEKLSESDLEKLNNSVMYIMADGNRLYGFNAHSGCFGVIDEQGVHFDEKRMDVSALNPENNYYPHHVIRTFFKQDIIYLLAVQSYAEDVVQYDLIKINTKTNNSEKFFVKDTQNMAYAQDGKFYVLKHTKKGYSIVLLDTNTNEVFPVEIDMESFKSIIDMGGFTFDERQNALYFSSEGIVYQSVNFAPFTPFANINTQDIYNETEAHVFSDGRYAMYFGHVRIVEKQEKVGKEKLVCRVQTLSYSTEQDFNKTYPTVPLVLDYALTSTEKLAKDLTTQNSDVDIYYISADHTFEILKEKGLLHTIQSPVLNANVEKMYPSIKQLLQNKEGQAVAYPTALYIYNFSIHKGFWNLAFSDNEIPQNMDAFMDAWYTWEKEFAYQYPEIEFVENFDFEHYCKKIITLFIQEQNIKKGDISFQDKTLLHALNTLKKIRDIRKEEGRHITFMDMDAYDKKAHIFSFLSRKAMEFPNESKITMPEEYFYDMYKYDFSPHYMAFHEGTEQSVQGMMKVFIINPYSKHKQEAENLIALDAKLENNPDLYYALYPDLKEPLLKPDHEEQLKKCMQEVETITEELKNASDKEQKELNALLLYYQGYIQNQEQNKWLISEKNLAQEQQTLRKLMLNTSLYQGDAAKKVVNELCKKYAQNAIKIDVFLKTLENKMHMIYEESVY